MSRKIVIEPTFCEAHFLDAHIQNVCDYLKPDIFIFVEGMFPKGPENTTKDIEEFKKKWTLDGTRGFDFPDVRRIIIENSERYPGTVFVLIPMEYPADTATDDAYYLAFTSWLKEIEVHPTDLIFALETDLFFTKNRAEEVLAVAETLGPDKWLGTTYASFFESPQIIFERGEKDRYRKLVNRYGTGEGWHKLFRLFFWEEKYRHLIDARHFRLFHYEWIRPGKYWDMRVDQLARDPEVWERASNLRELIRENAHNLAGISTSLNIPGNTKWERLLYLPDVSILDHPPHIRTHSNWVKYYPPVRSIK